MREFWERRSAFLILILAAGACQCLFEYGILNAPPGLQVLRMHGLVQVTNVEIRGNKLAARKIK